MIHLLLQWHPVYNDPKMCTKWDLPQFFIHFVDKSREMPKKCLTQCKTVFDSHTLGLKPVNCWMQSTDLNHFRKILLTLTWSDADWPLIPDKQPETSVAIAAWLTVHCLLSCIHEPNTVNQLNNRLFWVTVTRIQISTAVTVKGERGATLKNVCASLDKGGGGSGAVEHVTEAQMHKELRCLPHI